MEEEKIEIKKVFYLNWGFHRLVKDVANYTNESFFKLMETPALAVFNIAQMMIDESELNTIQSNSNTRGI
ncbi:hypothetical protein [Sphingobacterium sp. 1.A.5]|uniref:hypothetical protein n=1 Tax=Sphingobacterium sp. 1.A.5 TaxID=2044604 RepID=UPI000C0C03E0|nr:hypothetical protein [Sphingobacterium sp. 1.A.5]